MIKQPQNTIIKVNCSFIESSVRIAVISDLHNSVNSVTKMIENDKRVSFIVINGDILYAGGKKHSIYDHMPDSGQHLRNAKNALALLREAVKTTTVIFSTGNHELYFDNEDRALLNDLGVHFLDDKFQRFGDIVFGGLSSPYKILAGTGRAHTKAEHKRRWEMVFDNVNTSWLDEFERQEGYKILLCHHPEFYEPFLKNRTGIDLILAGHAHGGQIRILGKGLFAYGQGFLPKYTKGIYDNKLIVSAGLSNTSKIPRIWNPTELVCVDLVPKGYQE